MFIPERVGSSANVPLYSYVGGSQPHLLWNFLERSSKKLGPAPPTTPCLLSVQSQNWDEEEISQVSRPDCKMVVGDLEQHFSNCRS